MLTQMMHAGRHNTRPLRPLSPRAPPGRKGICVRTDTRLSRLSVTRMVRPKRHRGFDRHCSPRPFNWARLSVRHHCLCPAAATKLAEHGACFYIVGGELRRRIGAVCDGLVGASEWDVGAASGVRGAVCFNGGVLVWIG